jgi:formate dehydrogenase subunit beta
MIDSMIDAQAGVLPAIQGVLRDLLQKGIVDAWLVPMKLAPGAGSQGHSVVPMLVTDPAALDQADPLAPILPINAARAASQLTLTHHTQTLGLLLRSCEIN